MASCPRVARWKASQSRASRSAWAESVSAVLCPEGDDHLVGGADGYLSPIDRQDERHPASLAGDIYRKPNVEVVDAICESDRAGHR